MPHTQITDQKMSTAHRKSILLSTLVLGLNGASVADFNALLRALCASHEKSGHYRQKENVDVHHNFQLFSVSRWTLWRLWQRQLPDSVRAALAAARRHEHPCCRALVYRDHLCDRRMRRTAHTEPHAKKKLDAELAGDKKVPPPPHFSRRARSSLHVISRARGTREARRGRSSHARARILPKKLSCR